MRLTVTCRYQLVMMHALPCLECERLSPPLPLPLPHCPPRKDARLSLSTAAPSIGGSAPKLETCHLSLIPNAFADRRRSSFKGERKAWGYGEEAKKIEAAQV